MLNTIVIFMDDSKETHIIAENIESWCNNSPVIVNSIDEIISIDYDVILADFYHKLELENNKEIFLESPMIFIDKNFSNVLDEKLLEEPYTVLPMHFTQEEFKSALELAFFKHKLMEKYQRSRKISNDVINSFSDSIMVIDVKGTVHFANDAASKRLGLKKEEIIGKNIFNFVLSKSHESRKKFMDKVVKTGKIVEFEDERDGSYFYYRLIPMKDHGEIDMIIISILDITKKKYDEKNLRSSEWLLKNVLDGSPISQFVVDKNHKIIYWNKALEKMTGYKAKYMVGTKDQWKAFYDADRPCIVDLMLNDVDDLYNWYKGNLNKSKLVDNAYVAVNFFPSVGEDGKWIYFTGALIKDVDGKTIGAVETLEDITERKEMEVKLKKSLNEKEMLLKEIHHRVKNNLMVISSLLNLQSNYIKDKDDFEMFRESQARAKSMALIHELLYQSDDLKRIDFGNFLKKLSNDLYNTYIHDPERIKMVLDLEETMLDINTSIPLGLMVNELVSNCMKHAFPDKMEGEIKITLKSDGGYYTMVVADNGIGLPKDLDFRNTDSLGLQLVNNLTNQIEGKLKLKKGPGTVFKITFKETI